MAEHKLPNNRGAVLLSCLINGEQYGRALRQAYRERTKRELPLGSLYTTLDRMVGKILLESRLGDSCHNRGGNRRKYYKITRAGKSALRAYTTLAKSLGR